MSYWIFKISTQSTYPDVLGKLYVYDNRHSVRVGAGDEFIYLEKAGAKYALIGAGRVSRVISRKATAEEKTTPKITRVFKAQLTDVAWFAQPFDLSSQRAEGRQNRRRIGLPDDLNSIGWSISMPRIEPELFVELVDTALNASPQPPIEDRSLAWFIDDSWSLVRKRFRLGAFRAAVLARHNYACVICGTRMRSVLEVAHIRSYASAPDHRANPANGICLCRFCHACFDSGELTVLPDGTLNAKYVDEPIARAHFTAIDASTRRLWLDGVNMQFLAERSPTIEPV